jgi:hypothetical protein
VQGFSFQKNNFIGGFFMPYGSNGFSPFVWIILVLIVLQWFRVGSNGFDGIGGPGGPGGAIAPERGLLNNGGLFIIAIFLLAACGCFKTPIMPPISPIRYSSC